METIEFGDRIWSDEGCISLPLSLGSIYTFSKNISKKPPWYYSSMRFEGGYSDSFSSMNRRVRIRDMKKEIHDEKNGSPPEDRGSSLISCSDRCKSPSQMGDADIISSYEDEGYESGPEDGDLFKISFSTEELLILKKKHEEDEEDLQMKMIVDFIRDKDIVVTDMGKPIINEWILDDDILPCEK